MAVAPKKAKSWKSHDFDWEVPVFCF